MSRVRLAIALAGVEHADVKSAFPPAFIRVRALRRVQLRPCGSDAALVPVALGELCAFLPLSKLYKVEGRFTDDRRKCFSINRTSPPIALKDTLKGSAVAH